MNEPKAMTEAEFSTLCGQIERKIAACESALRRKLSDGERRDLILDNFAAVLDSQHARDILNTMRICGYEV